MSEIDATVTTGEWLQGRPFTLVLPSKRLGVFAHAGADAALVEAGIEPQAMSASSGGSNHAILKASGLEPDRIKELLFSLSPSKIWDVGLGLGLVKGELLDQLLRDAMPVTDFADAVIETRISVFDVWSRTTEVIEEGDMIIASRASSAIPLAFQPVRINGRPKLDGGIKDHAGMAGVKPGEFVIVHDLSPDKHEFDPKFNSVSIEAHGIPSVNPFRLKQGIDAYYAAKENMQRALESTISRQV